MLCGLPRTAQYKLVQVSVMTNIACQLGKIYDHLRDELLGMSVTDLQIYRFNIPLGGLTQHVGVGHGLGSQTE